MEEDVFLKSWIREATHSGEAKVIRLAAHLTRAELAQAIPVHPLTVYKWERGLRTPRGDYALRYARLLRALEAQHDRVVP